MSDYVCPRRVAEGRDNPVFRQTEDHWRDEGGNLRTCSYDGSLHPDDFLRLVREHTEVGPTDKSYKFYVHAADEHVRGAGKFYTHHLSKEQGDEFITLWEEGKVLWGYPGRPYVRLFIPHTAEADDS